MSHIFIWLLIVWVAVTGVDSIAEKISGVSEVSVFQEYCITADDVDVYSCEKNGLTKSVTKNRYKIDFNNQRVVSDFNVLPINENCSVFDKDNWVCGTDDSLYGMSHGFFSSSIDTKQVNGKTIIVRRTLTTPHWIMSLNELILWLKV
jgi:hypothetical protein